MADDDTISELAIVKELEMVKMVFAQQSSATGFTIHSWGELKGA